MLRFLQSRWRMLVLLAGALVALFIVGGLLFIWSGAYNIAASAEHLIITRWLLDTTMRRSVAVRSLMIDAPPLDDPDLVRLGAGHYQSGCAPCHGGPAFPQSPVVANMLPSPPPLKTAAHDWSDAELFWIVKHGVKYTGMPAWVAEGRDDEVWAVVAFLRKLPELDADEYAKLTFGNTERPDRGAREIVGHGRAHAAMTACARCHGDARNAPTSRLVPRLAGQSGAYLVRALREFADGKRASGIMQPIAAELVETEIRSLAAYYAELPLHSSEASRSPAPARVERGREIATRGVPESGVPPCLACHSGRAAATFPLLAGQSASYMAQQLKLWKRGLRDDTTHGAIMSAVAQRLTDEQIDSVTLYFESAPPDGAVRGAGAAARDAPR